MTVEGDGVFFFGYRCGLEARMLGMFGCEIIGPCDIRVVRVGGCATGMDEVSDRGRTNTLSSGKV